MSSRMRLACRATCSRSIGRAVLSHVACVLGVAALLTAGCGTRAEQPEPSPTAFATDPVAAALCPLPAAPTATEADVAALAKRAEQAQTDVAARVFPSEYRAMSSAAFAVHGAAASLASLNAQVPEPQRTALAASEPFRKFRSGLAGAQQLLDSACQDFETRDSK